MAVLDIETAVASGTAHNVVPTQTVYLVAIAGTVQHVSGTSALNIFGDLERCALRPGNVHSAHGWRALLDTVATRNSFFSVRQLIQSLDHLDTVATRNQAD